ncbi:ABC transporter substrate-binding protein [Geodermatophilus sp. URMC 64]
MQAISTETVSRRNFLRLMGLGGAVVVGGPLLAACGSGSQSNGAASNAQVDANGTLTVAYHLATNSLDPLRMTTGQFVTFMYPMYDTLLTLDENADAAPSLATKWEYSADGTTLTLTLRDDVTFHDGTKFDADAVKVNIERVLNTADSPVRSQLRTVQSVTVQDPTTAVIQLSSPDASLLGILADRPGAMVSPKAIADGVDLNTEDAGSGPYRLTSFAQGDEASYERYDDYWDKAAAPSKTLVIKSVNDGQARLNGATARTFDIAYLTPTQFQAADKAGLQTASQETLWYIQLAFNVRGALADQNVRLAIAHAIDRQTICKTIYFGQASPTSSMFPSWYWAADPDIPADYYPYDPAKAKKFLGDSGLSDVSFEMIFAAGSDPYPQFAEILQAQMKDVGITMNPRAVDINQLASEFAGGKTDCLIGGGGQMADPSLVFETYFAPNAFFNPAKTQAPDLADAISRVRTTTDRDARLQVINEASQMVADRALCVPILAPKVLFAYNGQRVATYRPAPLGAIMPTRGVGVLQG